MTTFPLIIISPMVFPSLGTGFIDSGSITETPSVSLAAVVAKPDEKWGETPCAFVELIKNKTATENEIIDFCRKTLAGFKLPKKVIFSDLPKTSTGKIQKFELRKKAKELN